MDIIKCGCGMGYASSYDNKCKFCREYTLSRAIGKKVNVKHRGDGMSVEQHQVATGIKKRSEVYI